MAGVMLFSAGLDSFILKSLYRILDKQCLFVDIGTEENKIEKQFIQKYYPGVQIESLSLVEHELSNKIIPFRNYYLALLAANYGNEIYFGFTAGDTTKDKDYVFKSQVEGVLNYFSIDTHKVHYPGPFSINMPLKDYTKTDLVALYLQKGFSRESLLTKSISCYKGTDIPCGKCRSCLRKYVALSLNEVDTTGYWQNNPLDFLQSFYEESLKKNRHAESEDIKHCLIKNGLK